MNSCNLSRAEALLDAVERPSVTPPYRPLSDHIRSLSQQLRRLANGGDEIVRLQISEMGLCYVLRGEKYLFAGGADECAEFLCREGV